GALRADREVGFEVGTAVHCGRIVSRAGRWVVVAFDEFLGATTAAGRLITDSRWLLLALHRRLRDVENMIASRATTFCRAAALRVIGARAPALGSSPIAGVSPELTGEQRRLVEIGHCADFLALWGPAGTG